MPETDTAVNEHHSLPRGALPLFRTEETRAKLMAMDDEALRRWPTRVERLFVATRYGRTHVVASGDPGSPPLVLLHPMGIAAFAWSSIAGELSKAHRLYALDTIGDIGCSELTDPKRTPKTGRDYTNWLADVYQALGLTRADVVAGSMGGWIAMNLAIRAPQRVRRLVLLGPMGLPSWPVTLRVFAPILTVMVRPTEANIARVTAHVLGNGERVNRELAPWMRINMRECKSLNGWPLPIPARKLRRIKAPTLAILGGQDGLVLSANAAARALRNIASCELEVLPHAGHLMHIDEPERVGSRVRPPQRRGVLPRSR
jgi:pimeloyl-ACP methyl ester carboxylesterase